MIQLIYIDLFCGGGGTTTGNAVEVHMATALVEATAKGLTQQKQAA